MKTTTLLGYASSLLLCASAPGCSRETNGGSSSTSAGEVGGTGHGGDAAAASVADAAGGTSASTADGGGGNPSPPGPSPAGLWVFSGDIPNEVTVTLTMGADETFTFVETIRPITTPKSGVRHSQAGEDAGACLTTDTYLGTYATALSGSLQTVTWTVTGGTVNAVLDCPDPSEDTPGGPMTPADVAAYQAEALFPATVSTYQVTPTTLTLAPAAGSAYGGFAGPITLTSGGS